MRVQALQTPLVNIGDDIWDVLADSLLMVPEKSVVVVTSKILSLSESRVVPVGEIDKHELIRKEAEWYTEPHSSKYDLMMTIKRHQLFINAGIDESNANGHFVLWPDNPQQWANEIWAWLRESYGLREVGVIVSDSKTSPLYWGVTGAAIAHCGFKALASKFDHPDLFNRPLKMTQVNVAQALAAAAVYEMGEANERTPLAIIEDIRDISFQLQPPSAEELESLVIEMEDDAFAPILSKAEWKRGGGN